MKIVDKISLKELTDMSSNMYDGLVKAVVDVEKHLVAVDAPMHFDEEQLLLEQGSRQYDLWGINLYPADYGSDDFIEYDSMINVRSTQGNESRGVEDPTVRKKIVEVVAEVVYD